jgi:hypothetical protein
MTTNLGQAFQEQVANGILQPCSQSLLLDPICFRLAIQRADDLRPLGGQNNRVPGESKELGKPFFACRRIQPGERLEMSGLRRASKAHGSCAL